MNKVKNETKEELEYVPLVDENQDLDDGRDSSINKLVTVSVVCLVFMIVEIIGGYLSNSIAIMSDAAHLFSDLLGFLISIVSIVIAKRSATNHMSYGYHRAEVIGALVSISIIWGLTLWLLYAAAIRLFYPQPVEGGIMLVVAILGLLFNVIMGIVLLYEGIDHSMHLHSHGDNDHGHSQGNHEHSQNENHDHAHSDETKNLKDHEHGDHGNHDHDDHHDEHDHSKNNVNDQVNVRAALIHIIGDGLQNVGVIIAGAIVYFNPQYTIVDPICTIVFAVIVFLTTIRILKECLLVIMEGSPIENVEKLKNRLLKIEGVVECHDLHVWSLSQGKMSMTCHLKSKDPQKSLKLASRLMCKTYGISHTTIQVEDLDNQDECNQNIH